MTQGDCQSNNQLFPTFTTSHHFVVEICLCAVFVQFALEMQVLYVVCVELFFFCCQFFRALPLFMTPVWTGSTNTCACLESWGCILFIIMQGEFRLLYLSKSASIRLWFCTLLNICDNSDQLLTHCRPVAGLLLVKWMVAYLILAVLLLCCFCFMGKKFGPDLQGKWYCNSYRKKSSVSSY